MNLPSWLRAKDPRISLAAALLFAGLGLAESRGAGGRGVNDSGGARHNRARGALHPAHLSYAEMEFDRERGCLEVALRVAPEDLEQALRWHSSRAIRLESAPDLDQRIQDYLREHFRVEQAELPAAKLRWIGKELSVREVWLYFEMPLRPPPTGSDPAFVGLTLHHRLFFELQQDQIHALKFWADASDEQARSRYDIRFSREQPAWTFGLKAAHALKIAPSVSPSPSRKEPRLRALLDRCLDAMPELLFSQVDPRGTPIPDDWARTLLREFPREQTQKLDPSRMRIQQAIIQWTTGHLESAREHLERNADQKGVLPTAATLHRELIRAAVIAEGRGLDFLAGQLRRAAALARLEL